MRWLFVAAIFIAATFLVTPSLRADSSMFVDGMKWANGEVAHHQNDSNSTGAPVHVLLPELSLGPDSSVRSAGSVEPGTIGDLTLSTLSLKSRATLGAIAATTDQIELRGQAILKSSFEILSPGEQTISIAWNGHLHATGAGVAQCTLKLGFNPSNGVNNALTESDFMNASVEGTDTYSDETRTLSFTFDSDDVGDTHDLQVWLTTYAAMEYGGTTTNGAFADFFDSFQVTGWSAGLLSEDGLIIPSPLIGDFDEDDAVGNLGERARAGNRALGLGGRGAAGQPAQKQILVAKQCLVMADASPGRLPLRSR